MLHVCYEVYLQREVQLVFDIKSLVSTSCDVVGWRRFSLMDVLYVLWSILKVVYGVPCSLVPSVRGSGNEISLAGQTILGGKLPPKIVWPARLERD